MWGWGELARRVQPEARFREVFFEARYNLAFCRFRQAQNGETAAGPLPHWPRPPKKTSWPPAAIDRDLGGPLWYDRYNELFRRIQRLADQPATGLPNP